MVSEKFSKNVKKFRELGAELMETFAQLKEELTEEDWEAFYEEAFDNIEEYLRVVNNSLEEKEEEE